MNSHKNIVFVLLTCALWAVSFQAGAKVNENLIEYRQKIMSSISSHLTAIKLIAKEHAKNKNSPLSKNLSDHAHVLNKLANMAPELFVEKSFEPSKSKAKENIWDGKTKKMTHKFQKEMKNFIAATDKVLKLSQGNDGATAMTSLKTLGASCKSCHTDYKAKNLVK